MKKVNNERGLAWQCILHEPQAKGLPFFVEWCLFSCSAEMQTLTDNQLGEESFCRIQLWPALGEFTMFRRDVIPRIIRSHSAGDILQEIGKCKWEPPPLFAEIADILGERLRTPGQQRSDQWVRETRSAIKECMQSLQEEGGARMS